MRTARGAREWPGWTLAAAGAALCVLGWYGVSGEAFVEQQIPYLASATVPGAALIVAGIVLVALRSSGRPPAGPPPPAHGDLTDRRVERLYTLLVEPDEPDQPDQPGEPDGPDGPADPERSTTPTGTGPPTGTRPLALADGTLYHRPGCPLVSGKPGAQPVDAAAVRARGLAPCLVCEPGEPGEPVAGPGGPEPAGPAHPAG
ncbi:hypothetical protein [Kitasatospora sp. NPDC050463]|uniref:hypothetical protein n=1 Tax=Kitasatospora sp. NPDC050463 TaxID=3155786 RepID=UPI0033C5D53B